MLTGIIAVVIFISIIILVHELGHFWAAKTFDLWVKEFGFGLPPKIFSKKIGETVYSLNALLFGGFVKIWGEDREDVESPTTEEEIIGSIKKTEITEKIEIIETTPDKSRNFSFLPIWKRSIIIAAGVAMNFVLGWFLISFIFLVGLPQAVLITQIASNSPAAEIGIKAGDKVSDFKTSESLIEYINQNRGKEISLKIERGNEVLEFKTIPRINPPQGEGALGIGLAETGVEKQSLFNCLWNGLKKSLEIIWMVLVALASLIAKAFIGEASFNQISGPIGIVKVTAQTSSYGFLYLIQLLAIISLNLTVINLLPFPALDGGRLLFLAIEKIKGSPLPSKFEQYANAIGLILLLILMIIVTIKDIAVF